MPTKSATCTNNLLYLVVLRALASCNRLFGGFNSSCARAVIGVVVTGALSAVAAASYLQLGRAIALRINVVAESTVYELSRHRRRFSQLNIAELPAPVQRYFAYALKEGQPCARFVCLKQSGVFRTAPAAGGRWHKVHAEQYVSCTEPGYVSSATLELAPLLWLRGWDSLINGQGNVFWKLCSLVTVEDARGHDVDRAALVRYLSECPCFPTALLPSRYIQWQPISDTAARCHLRDRGHHVSAVFTFGDDGRITGMVSNDKVRALAGGGRGRETWAARYDAYRELGGVRVPTELVAEWRGPDGTAYPYARFRVLDVRSWDSVEGGLAAKAAAVACG